MPTDQASHVVAEIEPGRSSPTASVRYTEKTKVTMTALNAADPQSHTAHDTIWRRVGAAPTTSLLMPRSLTWVHREPAPTSASTAAHGIYRGTV